MMALVLACLCCIALAMHRRGGEVWTVALVSATALILLLAFGFSQPCGAGTYYNFIEMACVPGYRP